MGCPPRGIKQGCCHIGGLKQREIPKNFFNRNTIGEHFENITHSNAHPTDARPTTADTWAHGDSSEDVGFVLHGRTYIGQLAVSRHN